MILLWWLISFACYDLTAHPPVHPFILSSVKIPIISQEDSKTGSLKGWGPETTKACKQALFYLPALISSIYISVTVALHKVDLTYPTSMIGTRSSIKEYKRGHVFWVFSQGRKAVRFARRIAEQLRREKGLVKSSDRQRKLPVRGEISHCQTNRGYTLYLQRPTALQPCGLRQSHQLLVWTLRNREPRGNWKTHLPA